LVEGIGTPKLGQVVEFDAWPRSLEELATKLGRTDGPQIASHAGPDRGFKMESRSPVISRLYHC